MERFYCRGCKKRVFLRFTAWRTIRGDLFHWPCSLAFKEGLNEPSPDSYRRAPGYPDEAARERPSDD